MTAAAVNDRIESFGYTTNVGDITGVTAGNGLTGGGPRGGVTVNVVGGTGIIANPDDVASQCNLHQGLFSVPMQVATVQFSYSDGTFTYTGPKGLEVEHIYPGTGIRSNQVR